MNKKKINYNKELRDQKPINLENMFCQLENFQNMKSPTVEQFPYNKSALNLFENSLTKVIEFPLKNKSKVQKSEKMVTQSDSSQNFNKKSVKQQKINLHSSIIKSINNKNLNTRSVDRSKVVPKDMLKETIKKMKVRNIKKNFLEKIKRNNMYSEPIQSSVFQQDSQKSILDYDGFEASTMLENIIALFSILLIIILFLLYSLSIVFSEVREGSLLDYMQYICFGFYFLEIIFHMLTVKNVAGVKFVTFREIQRYYFKNHMVIDLISILILAIELRTRIQAMMYIRLFIVTKLPSCLERMNQLEVLLIKSYYHEQYWSLAKVFLFNFCFAHILAIFLLAMTAIDDKKNWIIANGLSALPWHQQYIWAYYWGTNIMLTVGFGDISANTSMEALCLIFIEMVSCICLAYNISCVGNLIANIRGMDIEKNNNLKILQHLSEKNDLSTDLSCKIGNYIEQSVNLKLKFNIEEEKQFVENLPITYKSQFLAEANKRIFENVIFLKSLMGKTKKMLAESIQTMFCHPDQIIRHLNQNYHLYILKSGKIGYSSRKPGSDFNQRIVDQVKVKQQENPLLLGMEFITRKRPSYEIKSVFYSIVYFLDFDKLISSLKESSMDYELYSYLRDKHMSIANDFQVFICQTCKTKHTSFTCPKLHYCPSRQNTINKEIYKQRNIKMRRNFFGQRIKTQKYRALQKFQVFKDTLDDHKVQMIFQKKQKQKGKSLFSHCKVKDQIFGQKIVSSQIQKQDVTDAIKQQFTRRNKIQNFQDETWTIACDRMKNYNDYFPSQNSCNLQQRNISENPITKQNGTHFFTQSFLQTEQNMGPINSSGESIIFSSSQYDNSDSMKYEEFSIKFEK